jgi:predicted esterase
MLVLFTRFGRSALLAARLVTFTRYSGIVFGNLTMRFRQCASTLALVACGAPPSPAPKLPTSVGVATAVGPPVSPPSTTAVTLDKPPLSDLPSALAVDGFEPSVMRLTDDHRPAPLFIIAHGAGGQAQWHCAQYATMLGPSAALLCLTGKRIVTRDPTRGYYYPDHHWLLDELLAAHASIHASHSSALLGSGGVYIGYSQGASMGVLAVAPHGDLWPRLALVEGGFDTWSPRLAHAFYGRGGQRVLFVCGTEHCRKGAIQSVTTLERAGVTARLLTATHAGHRPDGPVAARVKEGLSWLLQGDPRYDNVLGDLATGQ